MCVCVCVQVCMCLRVCVCMCVCVCVLFGQRDSSGVFLMSPERLDTEILAERGGRGKEEEEEEDSLELDRHEALHRTAVDTAKLTGIILLQTQRFGVC